VNNSIDVSPTGCTGVPQKESTDDCKATVNPRLQKMAPVIFTLDRQQLASQLSKVIKLVGWRW
jgi:hypothetical protein